MIAHDRGRSGSRVAAICIATLSLLAPTGSVAQAPSAPEPPRVAEVAAIPAEPAFGEVFTLRIVLRAGPGSIVALADTLVAAESVRGIGPGSWRTGVGPADSTDITAEYPVIALDDGVAQLPAIEVLVARSPDASAAAIVPAPGERNATPVRTFVAHELETGAVQVGSHPEMVDADSALRPRPAAGVLGGRWSVWAFVAVGLATVLAIGGIGVALPYLRGAFASVTTKRGRLLEPREEALRELESIRSAGMHENGRVDEFYDATTGVLRRLACRIEPSMVTALTSSELLERMSEQWGADRVEDLWPVIRTAERVKFGYLRPEAGEAERDWTMVHDWIRRSPEP